MIDPVRRSPRTTIGRFAAAAGVGVETVRFYQRRGLLPVPSGAGGYRDYDAAMAARLGFIRTAQAAGFTLAQIKELLALDGTGERARVRALAEERLEDIEARLSALETARRSLRALLHDCHTAPGGTPCPIIQSFRDGHA
jgi:MerR family mercuric resistance operon transcriptional regulator